MDATRKGPRTLEEIEAALNRALHEQGVDMLIPESPHTRTSVIDGQALDVTYSGGPWPLGGFKAARAAVAVHRPRAAAEPPADPEDAPAGAKTQAAVVAYRAVFPQGTPAGVPVKEQKRRMAEWCKEQDIPIPSDRTMDLALARVREV